MNQFADFRREPIPANSGKDLSEYPEEVRGTLRAMCEVFNLTPPRRSPRKGGPFSLWIRDGRELMDACRPQKPREVFEEVLRDLTEALHRGNGYTVGGPQSLLNVCRAKAGQMSNRTQFLSQLGDDPVEDEDGFVPCPRCGVRVSPASLDMRCQGGHYTRGGPDDPERMGA